MLEVRECMLRYYHRVVDRFGARKGTLRMSKYACYYAQGKHGVRKFRSAMARVAIPEEFNAIVRDCFPVSESRSWYSLNFLRRVEFSCLVFLPIGIQLALYTPAQKCHSKDIW